MSQRGPIVKPLVQPFQVCVRWGESPWWMTGQSRNSLPFLERYEGWYIKRGTLLHIDVPNCHRGEISGVLKFSIDIVVVTAILLVVQTRRTPGATVWLWWSGIRLVVVVVAAPKPCTAADDGWCCWSGCRFVPTILETRRIHLRRIVSILLLLLHGRRTNQLRMIRCAFVGTVVVRGVVVFSTTTIDRASRRGR